MSLTCDYTDTPSGALAWDLDVLEGNIGFAWKRNNSGSPGV